MSSECRDYGVQTLQYTVSTLTVLGLKIVVRGNILPPKQYYIRVSLALSPPCQEQLEKIHKTTHLTSREGLLPHPPASHTASQPANYFLGHKAHSDHLLVPLARNTSYFRERALQYFFFLNIFLASILFKTNLKESAVYCIIHY